MTLDSNFDTKKLPSVSIVKILPKIPEHKLFVHRRCYIGISLDNPVFKGDSLSALLFWSRQKFEEITVVVGDYLCRYNEKMLSCCDDTDACRRSESLGDVFLIETKEIFDEYSDQNIHLTRWKDHLQSKEYEESKEILEELFKSDSDFRASVEKDAFGFIKRRLRNNQKILVDTQEALKLCCQYFVMGVSN